MDPGSKIFMSYRALGLISNEIPLTVRYIKRRKENLITTVIGNAFHTYGSNKLGLLSVGNPHTHPITCMTADTYHVYTANKNIIYAWRRSTELNHSYKEHSDDIILIMTLGPHLISVDKKNILYVWDIKSEELYLQMEFSDAFQISCLFHPATYVNKILLGSKQGKLQLWNLKSNKLIFTFTGWESEVTVLEQAPAQDVVGIGLASGDIYLHNLKFDETVMKFKQEWGPVTGISFRTDGIPVMVSGSTLGHIAIWDLHDRRLSSQIWQAHKKGVTGLRCLPNEPKLVTSSADNTLKIWIFDMPDGGARLLNIRDGHSAPPLMARFHGSLGDQILAAGEDSSLRVFSTVTDILNKNLGQASYNRKATIKKSRDNSEHLKMPAITAFTSETTQEKPWDNIACIHRGKAVVTTWSFENQRMGDHKLIHNRFKKNFRNALATCLELSVCGNFIIIGYDTGHLDKYNIQSGIYRGSFTDDGPAHKDTTISAVVSDALNQVVVSGDQEGVLKWWKFRTLKRMNKIDFDTGIAGLHLHRDSGLLAVQLEDWSIQIADIDTKSIIRKLCGHSNQITDVAFSANSKWLVSASLDRSIRTWDLPSSTCIDMFCVPVAASSISFSPSGEFLATIHAGHLGLYLWANKACFQHISLCPLPTSFDAPVVPLPSTAADQSQMPVKEGEEQASKELEDMDVDEEEYESPEQISKDLITLALLPTSRWLNLLQIDTIKRRNKPVEPPKAPKAAPFFIPTVPGLDFKFGEAEASQAATDSGSRLMTVKSFECLTPFGEKLRDKSLTEAMAMLVDMGPTGVDVEIRGLDPDTGGSEEVILNFLKMIKFFISHRKYFEVAQGYLGLFLKIHSEFVIENEKARQICQKLLISHNDTWHSIRNSLNQSLSLISYFKNAAVINY
ncbi:UNVERIFIED_CONTAM: hypothetical protein GTU68_064212 [Idotea baltica]|nr:hypothetical protein [Idotea baltica]